MPKGDDPGTPATAYRVRAEAYVHQGHTAAVFLEGKSGFVDVSHCRPAKWVVDDIHADPEERLAGPFDDIGQASDARNTLERDSANDGRNLHIRPIDA